MRLTIQELSKRTKLSIPTLRVYVSRQKLGTKVGNNRFFSQTDVDKLLKGPKRNEKKTTGAAKPRKTASSAKQAKAGRPQVRKTRKAAVRAKTPARKTVKPAARPVARAAVKPAARPVVKPVLKPVVKPEPKPQTVKRSFWTRLFGGKRQAPKISLMQAKKS